MKAVYKLNFDCHRDGVLEGLFIAHKEHVDELISSGIEIYFGEVLGKHSEVCGPLDPVDITMVTDNEEAISIIEKYELSVGFNPFDYTTTEGDESIGEIIKAKLSEK